MEVNVVFAGNLAVRGNVGSRNPANIRRLRLSETHSREIAQQTGLMRDPHVHRGARFASQRIPGAFGNVGHKDTSNGVSVGRGQRQ